MTAILVCNPAFERRLEHEQLAGWTLPRPQGRMEQVGRQAERPVRVERILNFQVAAQLDPQVGLPSSMTARTRADAVMTNTTGDAPQWGLMRHERQDVHGTCISGSGSRSTFGRQAKRPEARD